MPPYAPDGDELLLPGDVLDQRLIFGQPGPKLIGVHNLQVGALRDAPGGKTDQHVLRIQVKKTRYILEAVGRKCEALKELQGLLGDSHDMEILQELLGAHPRAAEIEVRAREAAIDLMHDAVWEAEAALKAIAAALRGRSK